jgi:RNA ligase (TIGR02306 family)
MRKLATVRTIKELTPIDGADLIELATVDGWKVVVKKDEFNVGSLCIYFEIDSFLPDGNPAWQHLVDKHPRVFEGKRGHKLKSVKLRGQLSQGFLIPITYEIETKWFHTFLNLDNVRSLQEGDDVTEILGIVKYEAPMPAELAGQIRGNFPSFIKKTDQERCQNLEHEIFVENKDAVYEVSIKLDGTSFTGYFNRGIEGVCGRNWELKIDDSNAFNTLVLMFIESGLRDALREFGGNYAVQAELLGPGIQKNREGLKTHKLFIFDIYDIDNGCYVPPFKRHEILNMLYVHGLNKTMVAHVPIIHEAIKLSEINYRGGYRSNIDSVDKLLIYAEGPSLHNPVREGLVYKRSDGAFSFKSISNRFLLKCED